MSVRNRGNRRFAAALILLGCMLIAAVLLLDSRLSPIVQAVAAYQAQAAASELIEQNIRKVMERENVSYGRLVEITHAADGRIEAVRTDAVEVNRLKAEITLAISNAIADRKTAAVNVPLGTLTGLTAFSGRGPEIKVRIVPAGSVRTEIESGFESAGINQTRHRISLEVSLELLAVLPGVELPVTVQTGCMLAETVMVGDIPEVYLAERYNNG